MCLEMVVHGVLAIYTLYPPDRLPKVTQQEVPTHLQIHHLTQVYKYSSIEFQIFLTPKPPKQPDLPMDINKCAYSFTWHMHGIKPKKAKAKAKTLSELGVDPY